MNSEFFKSISDILSYHAGYHRSPSSNHHNNHVFADSSSWLSSVLNNLFLYNTSSNNNVTHSNSYVLEPAIVSGINISLSILYILTFLGVMLFVVIFTSLRPVRKQMKRNQHKMIMLVFLLCILQCCGLIARLCYDSFNLNMVLRLDHYVQTHYGNNSEILNQFQVIYSYNNSIVSLEQAGIEFSNFIAMSFFGSAEVVFVLLNLVVMMVVMCFVDNVFLTTVRISSGMVHSKTIRRVTTLVNVITLVSSLTLVVLIMAAFFFVFFHKLQWIADYQTYFFIAGYVVFVLQIILQVVVSNATAASLLRTISKLTQSENKEKSRRPIIKVMILQACLVCCALLQIVAVGCAIGLYDWIYLTLFYAFVNSLGILLFACVSIALYHPIFTDTAKVFSELNHKNMPSTTPNVLTNDDITVNSETSGSSSMRRNSKLKTNQTRNGRSNSSTNNNNTHNKQEVVPTSSSLATSPQTPGVSSMGNEDISVDVISV
ncbi:hypothetical protein C9374_000526 [Naegleria lovaniensis]|uniref:Uncharacterized protein n=1 Tax=Naegleria lovaniensis TaxID=51637 RepID=A0AA88KT16_NAELO|nr:uncharacterized protein C9374_000526 [Naegleria lovaniensis]KAG2388362.1 hypothetical protein C9374_000526 [Naegleria lovaniensis]